MTDKKFIPLALTAVAAGIGITWLVRQRGEEVIGLSTWQQVLARRHGAEKARQMAEAVRQQHATLAAEATLPGNQALRWHLTENILPGLALYRVLLQEHGGDTSAALAEVDEVFRPRLLAKSQKRLAPLKVLPEPFRLFKLVLPQVMKQYPAEGWDMTYVENSDVKVAFNMTSCFYLKTLTDYGAPELTASFCKGDDVMAECFPSAIRFVRPHTLGRGDKLCDFQYCLVRQV